MCNKDERHEDAQLAQRILLQEVRYALAQLDQVPRRDRPHVLDACQRAIDALKRVEAIILLADK